jgi:hypothetical protein
MCDGRVLMTPAAASCSVRAVLCEPYQTAEILGRETISG